VITGEGAGNRVKERKRWMTITIATKRTIAMAAGGITLNSLITGVIFGEIMLSGLGASIGTLSMIAILNGIRQFVATCP